MAEVLADKRSQILEAAGKLFAQKGFHQTRVEEIATLAGVGKGTVYEYFSSKKHLFQEMLIYISEAYFDAFRAELAKARDFKSRLRAIFEVHLKFLYDNRDMARLIFLDHHSIGNELQQWMVEKDRKRNDFLAKNLQEGAETGEVRQLDYYLAAQIITGTLLSTGFDLVIREKEVNITELVEKAVDILWQGLSGQGNC